MKEHGEDLIKTLKDIARILDGIKYECASREYVLDEDQMGWVFYCRDIAQITIRNYENMK